MNKTIVFLTRTLLIILLVGCNALTGEEVARLPINEVTTDEDDLISRETTLDLKQGEEIAIWSDMDFEYDGEATLWWRIEIWKDGEELNELEINPTNTNITIGQAKTTINGKTDWSFSGRNTEITIEEAGQYTFKAVLMATENSTLKVNKAELVLKK